MEGHLNSKFISQIELITENLISFIKPKTTEDTILKILIIFENIKAYYSIKEYFVKNKKFLFTEDKNPKKFNIKIEKLNISKIQNLWENPSEIFDSLKSSLTNIKKTKGIVWEENSLINSKTEILENSNKKLNYPSFLKIEPKKKKKINALLIFSEMIFILRPLIHCYLLKIYKSKSYKPYIFNIFIDFIWFICLVISENPTVLKKSEVRFRLKNIFFNYMLRSPFYDNFVKKKILFKILGVLFKEGIIKNLFIRLIDFRSSFSYVM